MKKDIERMLTKMVDKSKNLSMRQKIALWGRIAGYTHREIGEKLGVTPERARQIIAKSLRMIYGQYFYGGRRLV